MDSRKLNLQVVCDTAVAAAKKHDARLLADMLLLLQKVELNPLVEQLMKIPLSLFLEELRAAGFQGKKEFCEKLLELEKELEAEPGHKKYFWKVFLAAANDLGEVEKVISLMERVIRQRETDAELFKTQVEFTAIPNGNQMLVALVDLENRAKGREDWPLFRMALQAHLAEAESRNEILLAVCFIEDGKSIQLAVKAIADTVWNTFVGTQEEQKKIFDSLVWTEGKNRQLTSEELKGFEFYALSEVLADRVGKACTMLQFAHFAEERLVKRWGEVEGMKDAKYWHLDIISAAKNISECVDCLGRGYAPEELGLIAVQFRRSYSDIVR
ncbi:Uncharacterised protein [Candidatus Gugararchaeum adminiculabundum]|nr:Uncharacterised protein [Candidatus Gugararchaeum adminiculabundum]